MSVCRTKGYWMRELIGLEKQSIEKCLLLVYSCSDGLHSNPENSVHQSHFHVLTRPH